MPSHAPVVPRPRPLRLDPDVREALARAAAAEVIRDRATGALAAAGAAAGGSVGPGLLRRQESRQQYRRDLEFASRISRGEAFTRSKD